MCPDNRILSINLILSICPHALLNGTASTCLALSVQRATAIKLVRAAVKLDTCAQLSEAGS